MLDPKTGELRRTRPRTWKGSTVNATIQPVFLAAPGRDLPYLTEEECEVCGEQYKRTALGVTWADGEELVRQANPRGQVAGSSGGFRTRGPVLWAMRVLKLERWAERHMPCRHYDGAGLPPDVVWACVHGDDCTRLEAIEAAGLDVDQVAELEEMEGYEPDPEFGF